MWPAAGQEAPVPSPKRQKHHHSAASEGEHPVQHPQPAVDGALAAAAAGAPMPVGTGWHSPLLWTAEDADADDAAQGFVLAAAGRVHAVGGVSDARPRRFSSLVPDGGPPVPTPGLWRLPPWSALTPGQAVAQTELDATLARLHAEACLGGAVAAVPPVVVDAAVAAAEGVAHVAALLRGAGGGAPHAAAPSVQRDTWRVQLAGGETQHQGGGVLGDPSPRRMMPPLPGDLYTHSPPAVSQPPVSPGGASALHQHHGHLPRSGPDSSGPAFYGGGPGAGAFDTQPGAQPFAGDLSFAFDSVFGGQGLQTVPPGDGTPHVLDSLDIAPGPRDGGHVAADGDVMRALFDDGCAPEVPGQAAPPDQGGNDPAMAAPPPPPPPPPPVLIATAKQQLQSHTAAVHPAGNTPMAVPPAAPPSSLFATASGKAVVVSAAAAARAAAFMGAENAEDSPTGTTPGGGGVSSAFATHGAAAPPSLFSTARGTAVPLSAVAQARGDAFMADDIGAPTHGGHRTGAAPPPQLPSSSLFSTASGSAIRVSERGQAMAASLFAEPDGVGLTPAPAQPSSSLFATAAGSAIHVSEKGQAMAASLFAEPDAPAQTPARAPPPQPPAFKAPQPVPQAFRTPCGGATAGGAMFSPPMQMGGGPRGGMITPVRQVVGNPGWAAAGAPKPFQPPWKAAQQAAPVADVPPTPVGVVAGGVGSMTSGAVAASRRGATPSPSPAPQRAPVDALARASSAALPVSVTAIPMRIEAAEQRQSLRAFFGGEPPGSAAAGFFVRADCASVTAATAANVKLPLPPPMDELTPSLAHFLLLSKHGASPTLCTADWVANHWRWIALKLAAYERCWPQRFTGTRAMHAEIMMHQLGRRYNTEHVAAKRSVLRRVAEGDTAPGVPMCVFVAAIRYTDSAVVEIDVCDGWYALRARLDVGLSSCVRSGRLCLGDKILVCGAGRGGDETPAPPLEAYTTMWLTLAVNAARRTPWDSKLGLRRRLIMTPLRLVRHAGGSVPAVGVTITRVFPVLHMETTHAAAAADGDDDDEQAPKVKTMRSAAAEAITAAQHSARADAVAEAAALAARNEWDAQQQQRVRASGAREHHLAPPGPRDEAALRQRVEFEVRAALEGQRLTERNVITLLKMRVTGLLPVGADSDSWPGEATITVWRPDDGALAQLVEGRTFVVTGLVPSAQSAQTGVPGAATIEAAVGRTPSGGVLELSGGRGTTWLRASPGVGPLAALRGTYTPRTCVSLAQLLPHRAAPPPQAAPMKTEPVDAAAVSEARRLAAVNAALAGASPFAVNAAAAAAASTVAGIDPATEQAAATPPPPSVQMGTFFDSCAVLVHAGPLVAHGARGSKQVAFFVDVSLVSEAELQHAGGGANTAPTLETLACMCPMLVLERTCFHAGGFVPIAPPAQVPARAAGGAAPGGIAFPVLTIAHATLQRMDARCHVVVASGTELTAVEPPPKLPRVSAQSGQGLLNAQMAAAGSQLSEWADKNSELLMLLRARAQDITGVPQGGGQAKASVASFFQRHSRAATEDTGQVAPGRVSDDVVWTSQALHDIQVLEQQAAAAREVEEAAPQVPVAMLDPSNVGGWVGRRDESPVDATMGVGDTLPVHADDG